MGDGITERDVAAAQRLSGLEFDRAERDSIVRGAERAVAGYRARREIPLANGLAPATVFDPRLPGRTYGPSESAFVRSDAAPPIPATDAAIAYAPVTWISRWIERRELTSERITRIYLDRLKQHAPRLECVVTLCAERALRQAKQADAEIAAGTYRGPLHGVPWGAKDLLDTAGIPTTWGATPYRDRVPDTDAEVVQRLDAAGAVLLAKLTLGALAYGDVWFGGKTRNPFNPLQGSSGSSAGSGAATAAGLVGFAIGTETLGSIVSPSMRCGVTGLRPTFGRVPRTGAMALCWSLDKIGPMCRTVEDTALVLDALIGPDGQDAGAIDVAFAFDAGADLSDVRIGYVPEWFDSGRVVAADRAALEAAGDLGAKLVELAPPDIEGRPLKVILDVEASAAFEELTLTDRDDELVWQEDRAWPNTFRSSWMIPAVELIQAQRFRRQAMERMDAWFESVDVVIGPSFGTPMLLVTNNTGHPSLTLRTGFRSNQRPHGITLWSGLFDEGTLCRVGIALERALDVWHVRPAGF